MFEPNVCRCCLSANGTIDLQSSFVNEAGQNEVYCETLENCFGINIMLVSDWSSSRSICAECAMNLKHASKFKSQVLQAEQSFATYFNSREPAKAKRVDQTSLDWDSDTPLQNLRSARQMDDEFNTDLLKKDEDGKCLMLHDDFINIDANNKKTVTKILSERKRMQVTCDIVLDNTTACPFRHHKSWFQCFYCTDDFMDIAQLRVHLLETHKPVKHELKAMRRYPQSLQIEISNLNCIICNINLINIDNLCTHFKEIHGKVVYKECIADFKVNASPFSCHLCGKEFHVFRTLTTHLNVHYANCICDVCGKSFLNTKRLKVHKRTHENGHFPCSICGKILRTKISKANHMETAHSKRLLKCQICFKVMRHYNDRIKHMSDEHNITHKFECPICSREYKIKHYLATHMRQTHGHKNKKCTECDMAFITNHGLKKHMLKHSGLKEFTCVVCCKSYARNYSLKEHLRAHKNDRLL